MVLLLQQPWSAQKIIYRQSLLPASGLLHSFLSFMLSAAAYFNNTNSWQQIPFLGETSILRVSTLVNCEPPRLTRGCYNPAKRPQQIAFKDSNPQRLEETTIVFR
jgi:hypothetical protein